jgi:LuxR family transcriptional regulator, quorum-sensing system regulator CinR
LAIVLGKTTLLKSGGLGATMTNILPDEKTLSEAFSIIAATSNTEVVIDKLRDLLKVDHVVYYMPKPSGAAFVRLTYPASWIKRYLQMNYANVDPISREAAQRTLPFNWNELKIQSAAEASFLADALSHGVGPNGFSIPLSGHGHWALFSISFSGSEQEWRQFLTTTQSTLIQIANRLHNRVVVEVFGEDKKK